MSDGTQLPQADGSKLVPSVRQVVRALAVAEDRSALYPPSHPAVRAAARELHRALAAPLCKRQWLTFNVFRGALLAEDEMLPEETARYRRLVGRLETLGVGSLTFSRGVREDEVDAFVAIIGAAKPNSQITELQHSLDGAGVASIRLYEMSNLIPDELADEPPDSSTAKRLHGAATNVLRELQKSVRQGHALDLMPAERLVASLIKELLRDRSMMLAVANIKSHDEYTLYHSVNVSILALALGSALELEDDPLRVLGLAGLLHDLGKVFIPGSVLKKASPLTPFEWDLVKNHPVRGAELLKQLHPHEKEPMIVAFEHHMRHDLQGYPKPPNNRRLHLFSRIVAICDAYDALTTRRSYRRAIAPDQSVGILMRNAGAYDPTLTKAFVNVLGIYPIGSGVRLTSGEAGLIIGQHEEELLRPRVLVVQDRLGRALRSDARYVIDTAEKDGSGKSRCEVAGVVETQELGVQYTDLF